MRREGTGVADTTTRKAAGDFGRFLHKVRTEVFEESLRDFARRVQLSPSYLNRLELSGDANPTRKTVLDIAQRLQMEPDALLLKAGFVPESPQRGEEDEYLLLLIGTLTPSQKAAVREFIKLVKDTGIEIASKEGAEAA